MGQIPTTRQYILTFEAGRAAAIGRVRMKRLNVLLCNSDRRVNNLIEVLVRDVCYNQAVVNCTRSAQVEDFIILAREKECDLVILAPNDLLAAGGRPLHRASLGEAIRAIGEI